MAIDLERGIEVVVDPGGIQPRSGKTYAGVGHVYELSVRARIRAGAPLTEAALLFRTPDYDPPAGIREKLGGQKVHARGLASVSGLNRRVVVPNDEVLEGTGLSFTGPVVAIDESRRPAVLRALADQTSAWYAGWVRQFSLRGVLQNWDPYLILDPRKYPNPYLRGRAVDNVNSVLADGIKKHSIRPEIADSLKSKVIVPGQGYELWLENLRTRSGEDREIWRRFVGVLSPGERHQGLFETLRLYGRKVDPLSQIIEGNPYRLTGSAFPKESLPSVYEEALFYLGLSADQYMSGQPEKSMLDRILVTMQLAREVDDWFYGKDHNTSEVLSTAHFLRREMSFIPGFLRAVEITTEGQQFSDYLRGKYIVDPRQESLPQAA